MESITRSVGRSKLGSRAGLEPVARMQCSKRSRSSSKGWPPTGCRRERLRVGKLRPALDHPHAALLGQLLQAAGERGDHLVLAGPHGVEIQLGLGEADAPLGQVPGVGHGLGHVQQGLGGDAAPQQADAAQPRLAVHQRDLHAQVGRQERRRVTARSAAQHDELCIHGGIPREV